MWTKIGELKAMLLEINMLGYFDINTVKFVYSNEERSIEENFAKISADKHVMQDLLKDWKEAIKQSCMRFPLFSLLGHNLYQSFYDYITRNIEAIESLPEDLHDILKLPILSVSRTRYDKSRM